MKINFFNSGLVEKIYLKKVLQTANRTLCQPDNLEIAISFILDEEIKELNKQFRSVDSVTDVLSFPLVNATQGKPVSVAENALYTDKETGRLSLGDIVICRDRAVKQATEYGHAYKREVCFLALHGYLHLLGYDHIDEADAVVMDKTQEEILAKAGLNREVK